MIRLGEDTTHLAARVVDVVVLAAAAESAADGGERWRVLTMRRAAGVRCTGAWELVHGSIEAGETPPAAARREVEEETGLPIERLYSVAVNPFYLPARDVIQLAVVFAAVVDDRHPVTLGPEHDAHRWCSPGEACEALAWPREHDAVRAAMHLLRTGDAGTVEDVLRIP